MARNSGTKSRIIQAAWSLFYEQGYDDTTVDEIIEKSGTLKKSRTASRPNRNPIWLICSSPQSVWRAVLKRR